MKLLLIYMNYPLILSDFLEESLSVSIRAAELK